MRALLDHIGFCLVIATVCAAAILFRGDPSIAESWRVQAHHQAGTCK